MESRIAAGKKHEAVKMIEEDEENKGKLSYLFIYYSPIIHC